MRVVWDYSYTECCSKVSTVREREAPGQYQGGYIQNYNAECPFQKLQNPESRGFVLQKAGFSHCECLQKSGESPSLPLLPGEESDTGAQSYPMCSPWIKPLAPGWQEPIYLPHVSCGQGASYSAHPRPNPPCTNCLPLRRLNFPSELQSFKCHWAESISYS